MANLLQGKYNYQKIVILDCRYDYEYNGGHIRGAVNINKVEELDEMYYNFLNSSKEICFVFYCEFSSIRGPSMYVKNFSFLILLLIFYNKVSSL